jgi:flagellar basal body-associated protein FliL
MPKRNWKDQKGAASKGVLVLLGVAIVVVVGVALAGIAGGIFYYTHKQPAPPLTIQPSVTNANNIVPPTPTPTPTPTKKKRR